MKTTKRQRLAKQEATFDRELYLNVTILAVLTAAWSVVMAFCL